MRIIKAFWTSEGGNVVADIAKAGAAIAFLSVIAANIVSNRTDRLDRDQMHKVAQAAAKGQPIDPLVTGSIATSAGATRLDPCVVRR